MKTDIMNREDPGLDVYTRHLDADECQAYLDGALMLADRARVALHLEQCNDCASLVSDRVLSRESLEPPPGSIASRSFRARARRASAALNARVRALLDHPELRALAEQHILVYERTSPPRARANTAPFVPTLVRDGSTTLDLLEELTARMEATIDGLNFPLDSICQRARRLFCFDEVSINMYSPESNTVDSVVAPGSSGAKMRCIRRVMARDARARDIEVSTLVAQRARLVNGGERIPEYDRALFDDYGHERYRGRLFIPILLVFDEDGQVCQHACVWRDNADGAVPEVPEGFVLKVLGTLSMSRIHEVSRDTMLSACSFGLQIASDVYAATVEGVVSEVARVLTMAACADSATVHFLLRGDWRDYFAGSSDPSHICYVVEAGKSIRAEGARTAGRLGGPPRRKGLGADACLSATPRDLAGPALREHNPGLWQDNIRSICVHPLQKPGGRALGLVYFHRREEAPFLPNPVLDYLVRRAVRVFDTISTQIAERRNVQDRLILSQFIDAFLLRHVEPAHLPQAMAAALASMLAIDLVSIFTLQGQAVTAGRFLGDVPSWSLRLERRHIDVPGDLDASLERMSFVANEGIVVTVTVPLVSDGVVIGLMLADYRDTLDRPLSAHDTPRVEPGNQESRQLLISLAELCAFALRISVGTARPTNADALIERMRERMLARVAGM